MPQAIPIISAIAAVAGVGASIYGANKQQQAQDEFNQKQEALQNQQKQLALQQQAKEDDFSKQKAADIVDEAAKVSASQPRVNAMQEAEDKATASNVNALEQANALGDESVGKSAEGNQSEAYLNARAAAASKQSDTAIKLARLFGASGSIDDAMQNQNVSTINNKLNQQGIDFRNRQQRRGFDGANDLLGKQSAGVRLDSTAGQAASAVGGALFNAGASGLGNSLGSKGGLGRLFSPSTDGPVF